jgi:glutamyl-tRNA synthetase
MIRRSMIVDIHAKVLGVQQKVVAIAAATVSTKPVTVAKPDAPAKAAPAKDAPAVEEDKLTLNNAVRGAVVTRFPPEASGFIHIGHAKAALVNSMLAKKYEGKMVFRFDDTNPDKEKHAFEEAIMQDLAVLGVTWDVGPTYSSDYMAVMLEKAEELLHRGLAYCDTTPREEMQKHRFNGTPTPCHGNSLEENLRLWKEMKEATPEGQTACLRAKISLTDENKAMRDPVMYRVNTNPHARQGRKYNVYPTYDFCCPIVDSIEGVTHALRTNEYHDRNAQYEWFIDALGLRKPILEDFSRLNMEYTVMSKRKLTQLVDTKVVDGWDDPRFPTVRGLVRRGLTVDALREFVKVQGMSKAVNFMEWSKLWNFNVQVLDPTVPRYTAVSDDLKVRCVVSGFTGVEAAEKALHMKVPELGVKTYYKSGVIYLDAEDVALLKDGDEVTLMSWGNAFVKNIRSTNGVPTDADIELHLDGDVKKTKYKLTWVGDHPEAVKLVLNEYDHLLIKKKVDPEDNLDDLIAPVTKFSQNGLGEAAMKSLKKGQTIQIERRGYYIVDSEAPLTLIAIPDGRDKVNHLCAKAQYLKKVAPPAATAATAKAGDAKSSAADLAAKREAKAAKKAASAAKS